LADWAASDDRVWVLTQPTNQGVAAGRNRAVSEARGKWLWFTDCDDEWSPHILERPSTSSPRTAPTSCCQGTAPRGRVAGARGTARARLHDLDGTTLRGLLCGDIRGHLWNKLFAPPVRHRVVPGHVAHSDLGAMGDLLVAARRSR
jgi:glycosyltransferase involved in cell wall biosynthesis